MKLRGNFERSSSAFALTRSGEHSIMFRQSSLSKPYSYPYSCSSGYQLLRLRARWSTRKTPLGILVSKRQRQTWGDPGTQSHGTLLSGVSRVAERGTGIGPPLPGHCCDLRCAPTVHRFTAHQPIAPTRRPPADPGTKPRSHTPPYEGASWPAGLPRHIFPASGALWCEQSSISSGIERCGAAGDLEKRPGVGRDATEWHTRVGSSDVYRRREVVE
jgi:hypothetical protein